MKLVTLVYNKPDNIFDDLLKVWHASAEKHMPGLERIVLRPPAPNTPNRIVDCAWAFLRVAEWVLELEPQEEIIVTDADIMFTGDCRDVFEQDFDLACTVREHRCYVNTGVWFYKPSGAFPLWAWKETCEVMLMHPKPYQKELDRYLTADQAALVETLDDFRDRILQLPCAQYNCEQTTWDQFGPDTRIVHVKSSLRDLCEDKPMRKKYPKGHPIFKLHKIWRKYFG